MVAAQVNEDTGFQRREWRLQRTGTVLLTGLLLAAALGLFGNGPLSRAVGGDGPVEVLHQRFVRAGAPAALDVTVAPEGGTGGEVVVLVSADYLSSVQVQSVSPEPDSVSLVPGFQAFHYTVDAGADLQVSFALQGQDIGTLDGEVRVGAVRVPFSQLVYP